MSCLFACGLIGWDYDHHRWCHLRAGLRLPVVQPVALPTCGYSSNLASSSCLSWFCSSCLPGFWLKADLRQVWDHWCPITSYPRMTLSPWRWCMQIFPGFDLVFRSTYSNFWWTICRNFGVSTLNPKPDSKFRVHSHYHCDFRSWTMSLNKLLQATSTSHQYQG